MTEYVIGIDIGTGSTKGVATSADGVVVATARVDQEMSLPRAGWAEMDAEQDWWADFATVSKDLMAQVDGTIAGVCVSGLGPCVVQTDENLVPRRSAILYGIDMRAMREIEEMTTALGASAILSRCGKDLSSQAIGPKLAWLRRDAGDQWRPGDRWFTAHTYVVAKLTGEWVLDHHTASQCDPLYDIHVQQWATDWAEQLLPGLALPDLVWPGDIVGTIQPEAAAATGLPTGTKVLAGTVDAWAEAYSVGVRRPGDLMLMYGSTMFMVQVLPAPTITSGLWTTSGVDRGSHTMAAGMATSGSLTGWLQKLTGGTEYEQLVREARDVPAGAEGLVMLPYFAGERSPIFDPDARGVVAGLTLRHTRGHLFRAAYEGIACGIRQIIEKLEHAAGPPVRVIAVGGGTQGGLWTQIVSDVCKIEQVVPRTTVGASYGDALLAAVAVGLVADGEDWMRVREVVSPDPTVAATYDDLYRTYTELYPATRKQVHRLARHS